MQGISGSCRSCHSMGTMREDVLSRAQCLSDHELVARVKLLAQHEREATVALIAHLAVLDERNLYLGEGCPSLFTYCTQVLHLAEHAAYNRIEAARAARQFPILLQMLADRSVAPPTTTTCSRQRGTGASGRSRNSWPSSIPSRLHPPLSAGCPCRSMSPHGRRRGWMPPPAFRPEGRWISGRPSPHHRHVRRSSSHPGHGGTGRSSRRVPRPATSCGSPRPPGAPAPRLETPGG